MKAVRLYEGPELRVEEVPVSYRRRCGRSKIACTLRGTLAAGTTILATIFRLRLRGGARSQTVRRRRFGVKQMCYGFRSHYRGN